MAKWCHVLTIVLGLAGTSPAAAQNPPAAANAKDATAEAEVRRLSDQEVQACLHKDPDALARVWSDDFVVTNWGGTMPNAGRTERLRITAIWMWQQGRWQQVARHANIVPERQPGQ